MLRGGPSVTDWLVAYRPFIVYHERSHPPDSFPVMSCVPIDPDLRTLLERLAVERVPTSQVPADLLDQLRIWGWVIGHDRLELTGIGWHHAGPTKRGLLG